MRPDHRLVLPGVGILLLGALPLLLYALDRAGALSLGTSLPGAPTLPLGTVPLLEQSAALISGTIVKPLYMLLSLGIIASLVQTSAPDLAAVGWGMRFFLIGEAICWINYPIGRQESPALEYLHSYGMVLAIAFLIYGVIQGMDARLLHWSDPAGKCELVGLCRRCAKYQPVPCGFNRLVRTTLACLIPLSLMPLTAGLLPVAENISVFGVPVLYSHAIANQLYEIRFCPLLALLSFSAALLLMQFQPRRDLFVPRVLFALGAGHLAFAFLRLVLLGFYRENQVWFNFWEETTELILVAGIALVLWFFSAGLGLRLPRLALRESGPAA